MTQLFGNLYLFASIQGLLLTILLFVKGQNKHANRVLSVAIFSLSVDLINAYLGTIKFYEQYPATFGATVAFPFIYGPIFYLYTLILSGKKDKFKPKYLLHFLPFFLFHLYLSPFYILNHTEKLQKINEYLTTIQPDLLAIGILKPVHGLLYTILSLRVLAKFYEKMKNSYSNLDRLKFNWLRYLLTGTSIVWCVVAVSIVYDSLLPGGYPENFDIIYIFISILIYAIGYGALNQPEVFNKTEIDEINTVSSESSAKDKYEKSSLGDDDIENIKNNLLLLMNNKKLYLNSEITLTQLAGELNVTNHNLSETINKAFNKNFYDFINTYRVEEFKTRIKNPEYSNYSLLAVAFDSGFSSKSSFNTIFKKYTNQTPSEYKRHIS
ncbi:MAG: hypothetical protein C0412_04420 [Flavobacterium sp.]|nr:hypothetical protein [Flavobacterium sp.]